MIADKISNAVMYYRMSDKFRKALKYLAETDFSKLEPGKYEIEGSDIYALVQKYDTKPASEGKWEAHIKYTDIQYIASGSELMGYACIDSLSVSKEYDVQNDFLLLNGSGDMLTCTEGTFVIFFPQDAHMPCISSGKAESVRKVVVKVRN